MTIVHSSSSSFSHYDDEVITKLQLQAMTEYECVKQQCHRLQQRQQKLQDEEYEDFYINTE